MSEYLENNFQSDSINRVAKLISSDLEEVLQRSGIFYRIFYRCKSKTSIEKKKILKKYDGISTFLRDVIGIRITPYFFDDQKILQQYLPSIYTLVDQQIDINDETEFKPTRVNFVFKIPEKYLNEFDAIIQDEKIDRTFELQLRTVLSEGWHEIDHDLRYKCKENWEGHNDLSRTFNGMLALLETTDWSVLSLFDQITYRHYKTKNWNAMLLNKFRLRFDSSDQLSPLIIKIFQENNEIPKIISKLDRELFIRDFLSRNIRMPLTVNNIVYYTAYFTLKDTQIIAIIPELLRSEFDNTENYSR